MIDFKKLRQKLNTSHPIKPVEIFSTLSKSNKYSYLRNVQSEVLEQWFEKRDNKDTIVKMNTGSGKTTVALLMLKSCLAEKKGKAVYVVPDNYLVEQASREAQDLGIKITQDESSIDFISGDAILLINIHKLFNGKSIFGKRQTNNVEIDYVVLDDVHACIEDVTAQFSLNINRANPLFSQLFKLFSDDLKNVNENTYIELNNDDPNAGFIQIPFWRVNETKSQLLKILYEFKDNEDILFGYQLVRDYIDFCNITFSRQEIEIIPYEIPINQITSFANAKRRIFMSATLSDDSLLMRAFDLSEKVSIVSPTYASDIGDRLILFPQACNENITDDELKEEISNFSKEMNVCVIVPSKSRAEYWRDKASLIINAQNILVGIDSIRKSSSGLYVFINKYDGIDLPDNMCRLLVIDGLPDTRLNRDRINESCLLGATNEITRNKIHKIEQGMGRGIRSSNDYCGIIIMGRSLINILYGKQGFEYFSEATLKQYNISQEISSDLKHAEINEIMSTIRACLQQDKEWVEISKGALSELTYPKEAKINEENVIRRTAFNLAVLHEDYKTACSVLLKFEEKLSDNYEKGYYALLRASYMQFLNPVEAQKIVAYAHNLNHYIVKPRNGIGKAPKVTASVNQAKFILNKIRTEGVSKYNLELQACADNLVFVEGTYKQFENAVGQLGFLLGFKTGCPDREFGIGPDVLWSVGDDMYYVIECKNGAIADFIKKEYSAQLHESVSWFKREYGSDKQYTPIIIHPSNKFDSLASPDNNFRIIEKEKISKLKEQIGLFCRALSSISCTEDEIKKLLINYNFTAKSFIANYTIQAK